MCDRQGKQGSAFFFEKKNQKTFFLKWFVDRGICTRWIKVFCFFFSKKKAFLILRLAVHAHVRPAGGPARASWLRAEPMR
jgi:hypothetical protein